MNPERREFEFLGTVEAVFSIAGRGTVIVPIWLSDLKVRVGNAIQLRAPDGTTRNTRITGVELVKRQKASCQAAFMLPQDVPKDDVADGTEIWLMVSDKLVADQRPSRRDMGK